jgi:hypothetical protein
MKQLVNPLTEEYRALKKALLTHDEVSWLTGDSQVVNKHEGRTVEGKNSRWLHHPFLYRPLDDKLFPWAWSKYAQLASVVCKQILEANGVAPKCFFRINANISLPENPSTPVDDHVDHHFPHHNLLIYLNTCDGDTVNGEHRSSPVEDKAIMFKGLHHYYRPTVDWRYVIVATFLCTDDYNPEWYLNEATNDLR